MKALRFLVIFMAVLIVAGFSVVVLTIAHRLKQDDGAPALAGNTAIGLPPQSRVLDMAAAGNRLALRIEQAPEGRQSLLIVDPATGRLVGTIALVPSAPPTPKAVP